MQEYCNTPSPETHLYTSITGVMYSLERIVGTLCIGSYYPEDPLGPGFMPATGIAGMNVINALTTGEEQDYPVVLGELGFKVRVKLERQAIKSAPMSKEQQARVIELSSLLKNGMGVKAKVEQLVWLTATLNRTIISRKQITEADMRPIRAAVVASRRVLEVNPMARFEAAV